MKQSVLLTITSLLSFVFLSLHHADDVVRGLAPGKFSNLVPIFVFVFWLWATSLVLAERRAGYVIILILSLLTSGVPVIHMTGPGIAGGRIAHSNGAFFFVWTLILVGTTTLFSALLAARELWRLRRKP